MQKRMLFGMACLLVHVVYATVWSKTTLQTLSWQLLGMAAEDYCPWCAVFCICDNQLSPLFQQDIPHLILPNQIFSLGDEDILMVDILETFLYHLTSGIAYPTYQLNYHVYPRSGTL